MARPGGFKTDVWIPDGADYDPTLPDDFIDFCGDFLRFPHGFREGQPVEWAQWQLDALIRPTWGLRWNRSGLRVVRTRFYLSARGTAKSTLAAAEALWAPVGLGMMRVAVDLFAASKPMAGRVFELVDDFITTSPVLDNYYTTSSFFKYAKYQLDDVRAQIQVRSGDAKANLGHNPDISYLDELLAQRNRDLYEAIKTSSGKKPEGLFAMMTTPDLTVAGFAREEYNYAKSVLADRSVDGTYLPVVYEADPDDDPFSPATWVKAAPNLGDFMDVGVYEREAARARDNPLALHAFKVFRLALWADAGTGFINMDRWAANAGELPDADYLAGLPCFMGLDMSTAHDLTSLCVLWWDAANECGWVSWRHWSTERMSADLDALTQGRWKHWRTQDGVDMRICDGNWIDVEGVAAEVVELAAQFDPVWIGIDSFRGSEVKHWLGEDGANLPIQPLHSGGKQMMAATERVEGMVSAGRLRHNGDPVAAWCAQNSEVRHDDMGYPKLRKMDGHRRLRIDAVAALCMAADRMLAWERGDVPDGDVPARIWVPLDYQPDSDDADADVGDRVLVW